MFLEFFYLLRAKGLEVSINEWMTLMEALDKGLAHSSFLSFYYLCRSILIKTEADYDKFDAVFAEYFKDVHTPEDLPAEFWKWLSEDEQERDINDMGTGDEWPKELEEVLRLFRERIEEQKEKHDGGRTGSVLAERPPWVAADTIPQGSGPVEKVATNRRCKLPESGTSRISDRIKYWISDSFRWHSENFVSTLRV